MITFLRYFLFSGVHSTFKVLTIVSLCTNLGNLNAQQIQDDIKEAKLSLESQKSLKIELQATVRTFDESGQLDGSNKQAVEYYMSTDAFLLKSADVETLFNPNYIVIVSKKTKRILVQANTIEKDATDPHQAFDEQFALLNKKIKSQRLLENGPIRKYELEIEQMPGLVAEYHYDVENKHFFYFKMSQYDENRRLKSIEEYSLDYQTNSPLPKNIFSETHYVANANGKWQGSKDFSTYQIEYIEPGKTN